MRKLGVVLTMLLLVWLSSEAHAQKYDWDVQTSDGRFLAQSDIDKQVESLLNLFSSLVGGGFVNSAEVHRPGGIDLRLSGVFTPIPDEFKDIIPTVQDPLEGADYVPFAFLHGNIGLPANFEVFGRFFTLPIKGDPGGNVTLLGGGLKYGLLKDNLATPGIVLIAGYQTILVPDAFNFGTVSTLSAKAYISKSLPFFTLYGGGGIDRTSLSLHIPGLPPDINKDYNVNYPQATVGLTVEPIPFFKINVDGNFGKYTSIGLGAALSFR
ncbi:MAG: hypothetical protein ONB48_13830 [candidate division KSB1 bacterium]|nr:hypothetical protein [candidate division KSB1 bacterium]MDZ7276489.1 hypothetical protein [candidate division KSB1 bacterium]MDZ7286730.1 hypothetical protein [candidate division KSB1 bacterium]MDZ7300259.1 hypothetical protein [candidate division KSB1 bacterium]MDZ7308586.1 hypothetical protein [candidate division KSB1 bacterium]